MKKTVALILCVLMLASALISCTSENGNDANRSYPLHDNDIDTTYNDNDASDIDNDENDDLLDLEFEDFCFIYDFSLAFDAFPPDTVMATYGEIVVTWEELFFSLHRAISSVLAGLGFVPEWDDIAFGDITIAEAVLDIAVNDIRSLKAIQYGALLNDVTLDPELIEGELARLVEMHGSLQELMSFAWQTSGIRNVDFFSEIIVMTHLMDQIFDDVFGSNGELLSDEDAHSALVEFNEEFFFAKHILISFSEDETEEETYERAMSIYRRLDLYAGDDIEAFFDELMFEYSEDPGLLQFPNGYLFQFFDMVFEFSLVTARIEPGTFSEPVETTHGFHIIFRRELDLDYFSFSGIVRGLLETPRYIAARALYSVMMDEWFASVSFEFTEEFYSINLGEIFIECD